jgi:hypothetical protein
MSRTKRRIAIDPAGARSSPSTLCAEHNAVVWPSGIGQVSPPIHPLTSSQGAVFLINSRQRYFCCSLACARQALFRSYGWFFAEFLGEISLVRLTLLELTTCVGLRYGFTMYKLRGFSWKRALFYLPRVAPKHLRYAWVCDWTPSPDFPGDPPYATSVKSNNAQNILHSVPPSLHNEVMEY